MFEQELKEVKVRDQVKHLSIPTFIELKKILRFHFNVMNDQVSGPGLWLLLLLPTNNWYRRSHYLR